MKTFNGQFDIRDQYGGNPSNCSVFSLKLTDIAFTELQDAIKHGRLQIKFKSETEGKIRFDTTKPWERVGKPFLDTATTVNTVVFAHNGDDDYVSNYGEITKSFKITPNVTESFKKTKQDMITQQQNNVSTKVLENKISKYAPKYAKKRQKMNANPTSPDSTSHQSRTPTPPPTLVVEKQYGTVEYRVLHILAIHNNKLTTEKLKEILHQRKLMAGPDMKKISDILDNVALQKNNKRWSLKKESLSQLRTDWAGYVNSKERQQIVDFIASEKDRPAEMPIKRKVADTDSRSTTPIVDDEEKHGKRQRLMNPAKNPPARIPVKSPLVLETSSRDSDHSNNTHFKSSDPHFKSSDPHFKSSDPHFKSSDTHFKPVESPPAMSMSSNGSHNSPNLSEASQLSPDFPKSGTPNHVSPVNISAKSVMQERYDRIQENIQKRERARKMSNEEVNENAIKAGLTAEEEKRLEGELAQLYPIIQSKKDEYSYKKQCSIDIKRYNELKPKMEETNARFDKYERDIRRLERGTPKYQEMYRKVVDEYRKECDKGFLKYHKEYREVIQRYTHIKRRLKEHYDL